MATNNPSQSIIDALKQQILAQGTTDKWTGQGYGSAEANANAMAKLLADAGITDIKQFGKVDKYEPVEVTGYSLNGNTVQNPSKGVFYEQIPQYDGEGGIQGYQRRNLSPEEIAQVQPQYGIVETDADGGRVVKPVSKVVEKDGQLVGVTGTTFGNKATGQALQSGGGRWQRQGGEDLFGGTGEGKGNTAFRVQLDAQGNPVFSTTAGSSSDISNAMKTAALGAGLYFGLGGLEGLFGGASGGALGGGAATGLTAAEAAGLGLTATEAAAVGLPAAEFAAAGGGLLSSAAPSLAAVAPEVAAIAPSAAPTVAGMGAGGGITAGYSGLGLNAGTAGLGTSGVGAGITAGSGLTGTGVLSGSALGTGLLGTTGSTALTGTGVLSGSTLGTQLLGTGAGTAATVGGVGNTMANLGTGALNTGVGSALGSGVGSALGSALGSGVGSLLSTGLTLGGGLLQEQTAREAAQKAQAMIDRETEAAKQAAQFRPVGMTTRFGTSQFEVDPATGRLISAGYTLTPEAKAQQDRLVALQNQGLTQAEQAQAQFAPLQTGAQSLFNLGNQYLAQSPQSVAQNYLNQQLALLQPGREMELANLQNRLQQQGRSGLSVAQGGSYGATTPELQALYNARAMQEAQLAAQAQQAGQQQVQFGAGLLGQGASAMGQYYGGQQAAYTPYTTASGQVQALEALGQQPLTMGSALGQQAAQAGANVGRLGLTGAGQSAELATSQAATTNPYASLLGGLGASPTFGSFLGGLFS